jgi:hypothetical protein
MHGFFPRVQTAEHRQAKPKTMTRGMAVAGKYMRRPVTGVIVRSNGSALQVRIDRGQPDAERNVWMRRDSVVPT